jgi:hypothetical protein
METHEQPTLFAINAIFDPRHRLHGRLIRYFRPYEKSLHQTKTQVTVLKEAWIGDRLPLYVVFSYEKVVANCVEILFFQNRFAFFFLSRTANRCP